MARVAILIADQFEDSEFLVPLESLKRAGHEPTVVGIVAGQELHGKKGGVRVTVERAVDEVSVDDFETLVIPGGYSPDKLRLNDDAVEFTREFAESGKLVAAICHAGSLLIEARVVSGRTLTSWPSIRTDLVNAGATWVDEEVVEDGNLVTSRKPDDLPAFCRLILSRLEGKADRADRPAAKSRRG
jgi:protease I